MSSERLVIGVVGQVNAGKSSVHESLLRYRDLQAVSAEPGWTREVRSMELRIDGVPAAEILDFPGFQRIEALARIAARVLPAFAETSSAPQPASAVGASESHASRPSDAELSVLLDALQSEGDFRHEELVIGGVRRCHALLLVVDTREAPTPAFDLERRLLRRLAGCEPIVLLNCTSHPASRVTAWRESLRETAHAALSFDAWHLAWAHEVALWRRLHEQLLSAAPLITSSFARNAEAILKDRERRRTEAEQAVALQIADLLIDAAAARRSVEDPEDKRERVEAARELMERTRRREQACFDAILSRLGFRRGDAVLEALGAGEDATLADPWSAREIGRLMPGLAKGVATGAAVGGGVGAATGFVLDLATLFTTVGAATVFGAKLGAAAGALAGGAWAVRDKLVELPQLGKRDAKLSREALELLAMRQTEMALGLFGRGHAALAEAPTRAAAGSALDPRQRQSIVEAVAELVRAAPRSRWSTLNAPVAFDAPDRVRAVRSVQRRLHEALVPQSAPDDFTHSA